MQMYSMHFRGDAESEYKLTAFIHPDKYSEATNETHCIQISREVFKKILIRVLVNPKWNLLLCAFFWSFITKVAELSLPQVHMLSRY